MAELNGFDGIALRKCLGEYRGPELTAPIIQAVIKRLKIAALDTLLSNDAMSSVQVISYSPDAVDSDMPWHAGMPLLRPSASVTDVTVRWLALDRHVSPTLLCRIQATFELHPLLTKELSSLTKRGGAPKTQLRRCDDEWLYLTVPIVRLTCESTAAQKARSDKAKAKKQKNAKKGAGSQAADTRGLSVSDRIRVTFGMQDSKSKAEQEEAKQPLFVQVESAYLALFVARPTAMTKWAGDETPLGPDAKGDTLISFVTSYKVPSVSAGREVPKTVQLAPGESERYAAANDINGKMRKSLDAHRSLVRSGDASWAAVTFIDDALHALQPVLAAYRHQISDMSDLVHDIQARFPRKDVKAMIDTHVEIEFIKRKIQPMLRVLDGYLQEAQDCDPPLARHIEDSKVTLEWAMEEFSSLMNACDSIKEESAAYRSMEYANAARIATTNPPLVPSMLSGRTDVVRSHPMQAARRSVHPHADHSVHNAAPVPQWPFRHELRKRRWKPGRPGAHIRMERVRFLLVPRDLPDPHRYLGLPVWPDTAARYSFQY